MCSRGVEAAYDWDGPTVQWSNGVCIDDVGEGKKMLFSSAFNREMKPGAS